VGTTSRQATESVRRRPPAQCCSEDHGFDAVIVKRAHWLKQPTLGKVSGKSPIRKEWRQTVCATGSKCLQRSPQGGRAARKGIVDLLPGAEKRSSEGSASDGRLEPNPEGSLHYSLLLGDGDINNRGKGDEGSNTPVCRPCGPKASRGPSPGQTGLALKLAYFEIRLVRLSVQDTALSRRRGGFDSHTSY
jgi:hypothetical protein